MEGHFAHHGLGMTLLHGGMGTVQLAKTKRGLCACPGQRRQMAILTYFSSYARKISRNFVFDHALPRTGIYLMPLSGRPSELSLRRI